MCSYSVLVCSAAPLKAFHHGSWNAMTFAETAFLSRGNVAITDHLTSVSYCIMENSFHDDL